MNLLSVLATLLETVASIVGNPDGTGVNSHANRNPFESRAGLSDVITVHVVGPDGNVKESKSTNEDCESLTRKESRP